LFGQTIPPSEVLAVRAGGARLPGGGEGPSVARRRPALRAPSRASRRGVAPLAPAPAPPFDDRSHRNARRRRPVPEDQVPELAKHVARHGANVVLDIVDAAGRAIGDVLESYVSSRNADLLVMGAYGHSRVREFVLGGATRSMISKPPLPILFSH